MWIVEHAVTEELWGGFRTLEQAHAWAEGAGIPYRIRWMEFAAD